jgi:hypothetical protein
VFCNNKRSHFVLSDSVELTGAVGVRFE